MPRWIKSSTKWLMQGIAGATVLVALGSALYILIYTPGWREADLSAAQMGSLSFEAGFTTPTAPARVFYSVPCTRWIAFQRLWASYVREPKKVGEIIVVYGLYVNKNWHPASTAISQARAGGDSKTGGDGDHAYSISDVSEWPRVTTYQNMGKSDSLVVSQFEVSDLERRTITGTAIPAGVTVRKWTCE